MQNFERYLITGDSQIRMALAQLNVLAADAILFVVDVNSRLLGSLTDGDIRRGFLRGLDLNNLVRDFIQPNPKFIRKNNYSIETIIDYRNKDYKIIPVLDKDDCIINVINFRTQKSYLPVDVVIMAGGRGERLKPLTDLTPKPLLLVGDKPIIEHNLDRLISFGVDDFWISIRYLGNQIIEHFNVREKKNVRIEYVTEDAPMGTIGSVSKINNLQHDYVLVTNSDLLTNLDYEDFFLSFLASNADLSVVTIPYEVNVPYAVLETTNGHVMSFKEKPTFTYYSNGGIYLMKREVLELIPKNSMFNATDLIERLISEKRTVHSYPLHGYWLDIGKIEDFNRAQHDIKHIKFH